MNTNPIIPKEELQFLEKSKKELNKIIKSFFSGQIALNVMLDIMYLMLTLYPE